MAVDAEAGSGLVVEDVPLPPPTKSVSITAGKPKGVPGLKRDLGQPAT